MWKYRFNKMFYQLQVRVLGLSQMRVRVVQPEFWRVLAISNQGGNSIMPHTYIGMWHAAFSGVRGRRRDDGAS